MKIKLSFLCLALLLALQPQLAYSQIVIEICPVCNKPKQNCPYKMNHPKCKICKKAKEQCPYKGNHPKCNSCGKLKEKCPYQGNHPTTGTLLITSTPSGAAIKIDGKYKSETPLTLENQNPGSYSITFSAEGYETTEKSVTVTAGKTTICEVELKKKQTPQAQPQPQPTQPSTTTTTSSPVETFTANGVSFKMIRVEGGTFTMGATSEQGTDAYEGEKPAHSVTLSSYYIGETEVTQELWKAVMGSNPSYHKGSRGPVENVSWDDCKTFISKLNSITGKNFRLPTEAEWEYAARGGNKSKGYKYSGSNTLGNVAWYDDNSGKETKAVKAKSPNELGIYDMSGNVWEWCQDWYGSYESSSQTNPTGPSSGSRRVYRGGSWDRYARSCRVSFRSSNTPGSRGNSLGLRLVL